MPLKTKFALIRATLTCFEASGCLSNRMAITVPLAPLLPTTMRLLFILVVVSYAIFAQTLL
jgi:hypothetical protein